MLAKIAEAQNVLYQKAEMLREESGISKEIVYELKLPQNQGEKAETFDHDKAIKIEE